MSDAVTADWDSAAVNWPLEAGEAILWQGRPAPGLTIGMKQLTKLISGLFGLCLFLYLVSRLQMQVAPFWDVWLIVLTVFFASIPLDILRGAHARAHSHYALTNRRALIATDIPVYGRLIRAFPMVPSAPVDLLRGRRLGSVSFGAKRGLMAAFGAPRPGFERIADSEAVFNLIGRVQRGDA